MQILNSLTNDNLPWYSEDRPKVSIVVLNWNKAQLTIECLRSLWEYTSGFFYEIIVVDNGSRPDEIRKLSALQGNFKLARLAVNRFFGEGNNIGAELAKGEFIAFMNNDVTVTEGWLEPLVEVFVKHSNCGAAGPKFIYPNGLLQEAGALLDEHGDSVQIGKYQDPEDIGFNQGRIVDYVSAATVLVRRVDFERILGFDFIFEPAYYEDVDICLKLGTLGLETYYIPESCVVHHENATTSDPANGLGLSNIVVVNREKFVRRYTKYLTTGIHDPAETEIPLIRGCLSAGAKIAAIYTPYNINPGGGERYLLSVAESLIGAGYETWLVTPETYSALRLTKVANIFGLRLQGLNLTTIDVAVGMPTFEVFVAMSNEIAPPIKALGRKNIYCCQFPFPCAADEIDRRRAWMSGYHLFVLYSSFVRNNVERQIIRENLPNHDLVVIPPAVDMLPFYSRASRRSIVSVGRFFVGGHCKQQDMLIRAFRRLHELGIDAEFHLIGSLAPEAAHREYFVRCQKLAEGLPVYFHVDASAKTLERIYQEATIYWHGAGFGVDTETSAEKCEHFGITVVEAMSAGVIPVVVNNGGPASIVQHGVSGYCYDSESNLINITVALLFEEESVLSELRGNCRRRALDFSKDAFNNNWEQLLKSLEDLSMEKFLEKANYFAAELRLVSGFDAVHSLWQKTNIPYVIEERDPFSVEYKREIVEVYEKLCHNSYNVQNELTSTRQASAEDFERGFPWSSGSLDVASAETAKTAQALKVLQARGMNGKRIIEFGSGWGNLAVPLAKVRQDITIVDIDRGFLDRIERICDRENLRITAINDDFIGACRLIKDRFDAAIFQSSFHHCLDFEELLQRLGDDVLSDSGEIFFFSEPIFENYNFPWGIRYDGESLWAVMFNKWLELGFEKSFFSEVLLKSGFLLQQIAGVDGFVGGAWIASRSETRLAFASWVLPEAHSSTFHPDDRSGIGGRFCRSLSRLPPLRISTKAYVLEFKNFAPDPLSFTVSGDNSQLFMINPGEVCIVKMPASNRDLVVDSNTFCPAEVIAGNSDTRNLGVYLNRVCTERVGLGIAP